MIEQALLNAIRLVPPGTRGKRRVASRLMARRLNTEGEAEIASPWGRFHVPSLREAVAEALLLDGVYEPDVLRLLVRCVRPGHTFIDVGANVGCFTVPMARHVGPGGRVLAVEASPGVFSYLARNIVANEIGNATLVGAAATDRDGGDVTFFSAPDDRFGMGTLTPIFKDTPQTVPSRTLDALVTEHGLERVDAIKVDVEGHEETVFRGASALLTADPAPVVVFEFLDWAEHYATGRPGGAQEVLMDLGYALWRLRDYPSRRTPLARPIVEGGAMLVACRSRSPSDTPS